MAKLDDRVNVDMEPEDALRLLLGPNCESEAEATDEAEDETETEDTAN